MCGSTNQARAVAFASALAFFNEQSKGQIGEAAPTGPAREHIAFVQSLGVVGDPPAVLAALADAEDLVLKLVREAQQAQQAIIGQLLEGYTVFADNTAVENLVATLNNIKDASAARDAAAAAVDVEGEKAEAALKEAFGSITEGPNFDVDSAGNAKPTLQ